MDEISEQRLGLVWPILADSIHIMAESLAKEGVVIRVVQGLRTNAEQDEIYAQGRTGPGKIVTNAKGGHSWHNFGMAVDCVPGVPDLAYYSPDWDVHHIAWTQMWDAARGLGLNLGHDWEHQDNPHFQLTGQYPWQAPDDEVRQIAAQQGLKALWTTVKL